MIQGALLELMEKLGKDRTGSFFLEMTSLSQSPRDRILWLLANHGGEDGARQAAENVQ